LGGRVHLAEVIAGVDEHAGLGAQHQVEGAAVPHELELLDGDLAAVEEDLGRSGCRVIGAGLSPGRPF
jgi:hypothetical protein